MTRNKEQFKTIRGIFLSANEIQYQCNFIYHKNEQDEITYTVELIGANEVKAVHLFTWHEERKFWKCLHPKLLNIELLEAIIEKIEKIEQIK